MKITSSDLLNYQLSIFQRSQTNLYFRKSRVYLDKRNNGAVSRKEYETFDIDRHVESFTLYNQIEDYSNVDNSLLSITFRQSDQERIHVSTKEVMSVIESTQIKDAFSYVSIISELGGIMFLLFIIGCFFATPLAEFSFKIDAIKQINKQG